MAVSYVIFSRWPGRIFTERSDFLAEGIACGAGAFFAARLPLPEWARWGLLIAYAAAFYWFADGIMLYLVGTLHGEYL